MKVRGENLKDYFYNYVDESVDKKGRYTFFRFTRAQRKVYSKSVMFGVMSESGAGIRMSFDTDGDRFSLRYKLTKINNMLPEWIKNNGMGKFFRQLVQLSKQATAAKGVAFFNHGIDVYINGQKAKTIKAKKRRIRFKFFNPEKEKVHIDVYLPLFCNIAVRRLHCNGNVSPAVTPKRRMICFGDSITQGFYAQSPTDCYVGLLAKNLDFDAINQGVGGYMFDPDVLVDCDKLGNAEAVTVAYGTNDWRFGDDFEVVRQNARAFFEKLHLIYRETPVFVLTPIWRSDCDIKTKVGEFEAVRQMIAQEASAYPDFYVIDGLKLVPHDKNYFADGFLHPNDKGFAIMAQHVTEEMRKKV